MVLVVANTLEGEPRTPFRMPAGVRVVKVDAKTGLLLGAGTETVFTEAFRPGTTAADIGRILGCRVGLRPSPTESWFRPTEGRPPRNDATWSFSAACQEFSSRPSRQFAANHAENGPRFAASDAENRARFAASPVAFPWSFVFRPAFAKPASAGEGRDARSARSST